MVEGFVPPPPEKANEVNKPQDDTGKTTLSQEAFAPREVQRVADNQTDKPKDPAQVYQTVFAELNAAKQGMLAVNDVIAKGGGPYAKGDALKAYQQNLDAAQQHYTTARIAADTFLFVCDKQGNPVMDATGNPVPSKENIAMRQQLATMQQDMQKLSSDQSPEGRAKLQQEMQASHQMMDLLRSSGYARANNAFALMFHSGDLQGQDRKNFGKTGVALLAMASKFDPAMMGPPPDANFMKHYDAAMDVVMGGKAGGETAPKPADQTTPKPSDQTTPKPGDQTAPPTDQAQGPKAVADGNQYYVDYRGLHVPTWTGKNPDGSAAQPFTVDGVTRADGMLKPVTDANGRVMGADNQPLMDANGMRRIGDNGLPIPAQFDASDPMVMQSKLDQAVTGPLTDESRAAYNKVIDSADKIDRVSIAKAMDMNDQFMQQNQPALQWESSYRQLKAQLDPQQNPQMAQVAQKLEASFNDLKGYRQNLSQPQLDALQKMWENVKNPNDVDKWVEDPANAASKAALTSNPKWADIRAKYKDYLTSEATIKGMQNEVSAKVQAKEAELTKNPQLADQVRKVRAADAMNQELSRVFASSVDSRAGYLSKLIDQEAVKKYMAATDKNSADAKAAENDPNVKEARRVVADLAKCNPQLAARLDATAKALGVDVSAALPKPADQTTPKPADQTTPKPADQTTPKPADQTVPAPVPVDQTPKPADQTTPKPADQTTKPADQAARTGTAGEVAQLTTDQANSPQVLNAAYLQYLSGTEGAKKAMPKEDFDKLAPTWEKALEANAAIKPEQLALYEKQAQDTYANQMALALALQKTGKDSFDKLVPDDLNKVTKEELQKAMTDSAAAWMKVNSDLNTALTKLPQDAQQKYTGAETAFNDTMTKAQTEAAATRDAAIKAAGDDKAKQQAAVDAFNASMQAAYTPAYNAKLDAQKALSPELGQAITARTAFLNDSKGVFAKQFTENMQLIDSYKHVDTARIQYAQALALQGGDDNKGKAGKLLTEALKNPEAAQLLQTTQDGMALLQALNLKTSDMTKAQDDQDKLFPEMKLARDATDASGSDWKAADAKFKAAEEAIDKEIIQRGQGKDVAESLAKVNQNIESMKMQLGMALADFQAGRRDLPARQGQDAAGKDADAKIIRAAMNGDANAKPPVAAMTQMDMLQALMGQKGPQMQAAMQRVLTDSERDTVNNMAVLAQKAQNVSLIRMQHAIKASEFGFKAGVDPAEAAAAKAEAKSVVESIAKVDPVTYSQSPEILGAIKQAERGDQMKVADGSAAALAFSEAAKDTIQKTQTGIVDWMVPGASLAVNSIGVATTGHYVSEVPLVGGLFGGSKEATAKLVDQEAMMILSNAQEAQRLRDQTVNDGHSQLRGLLGDVGGVATTFATGYGVNKGIQYLAKDAPVSPYIKVPLIVGTALATGGLANNAISGHELLASRGFIRNTVASGTTYAAIKGLEYMPTNRPLSAATLEKFAEKGVVVAPGTTGLELGEAASAQLAQSTGASKLVQIAQAAPARLNPLNYTPLRIAAAAEGQSAWNVLGRVQWAGWGGDATAQLFASGGMNLAEYNTRLFASKALTTFGIGYGFGSLNKGAAILSGEHLDGKKYDSLGAYWTDMNQAGLQSGLASSLMIPIMGKAMVPQSWQRGVSNGVTSLFAKIPGVDAAAATTALGSASLMWARPTMDATSRWGEATIYDNIYQQAQKRAEQLRSAAAQQLGVDKAKEGEKK
jgi:hypothetical protein